MNREKQVNLLHEINVKIKSILELIHKEVSNETIIDTTSVAISLIEQKLNMCSLLAKYELNEMYGKFAEKHIPNENAINETIKNKRYYRKKYFGVDTK